MAAGLVAVAGLAVASPAGATSGLCQEGAGVSVVVDSGSAVDAHCAPDAGGKYADAIFKAVGVELTFASQSHGFVCRVDGTPLTDECVRASPADAYWALFWSDGSGDWTYAASGVTGLKVPDGGFVAFAWQSSTRLRDPSVAPSTVAQGEPSSKGPAISPGAPETPGKTTGGDPVPVWVLILVIGVLAVSGAWIARRRRNG